MKLVEEEDIVVRMHDEKKGSIYVGGTRFFGLTQHLGDSRWSSFDVAVGIEHPLACTMKFSNIAKHLHAALQLESQDVVALTDWNIEPHRDMPVMAYRNGILKINFEVAFLDDQTDILQLPGPEVIRERICQTLVDNGLELLNIQCRFNFFSLDAAWLTEPDIETTVELQEVLSSCATTPTWSRQPTFRATLDYLRRGRLEALVKVLEENEWFDAKISVDLSSLQGKIEFAKDVAQFANAAGGLLVVGATNKKRPGDIEVLDKLHALDKDPRITSLRALMRSAQGTIDAHIHPPIAGVEVESSKSRKGEIIYVHVPPQPSKTKPFLVVGESVEGDYRNTFFSIPRRRRDGNLSVTAKEIHHLLAGKIRDLS